MSFLVFIIFPTRILQPDRDDGLPSALRSSFSQERRGRAGRVKNQNPPRKVRGVKPWRIEIPKVDTV